MVELDERLKELRRVAQEHNEASQEKRVARRSKVDPDPELQNHYQEGAFVLYDKYQGDPLS